VSERDASTGGRSVLRPWYRDVVVRAVGLFPLVVLTGCFVANPRWQGSGEDAGDDTSGSVADEGTVGPSDTGGVGSADTSNPMPDGGPIDDEGETTVPVDWWDTGWRYRRRIEWLPPDIGGLIPGVPVMVDVYSLGLPNEFADGGLDVRVVTDAGEVLPVDVDFWSNEAHEGVVWFRVPEQAPADAPLWLYHGNPGITENDPVDMGVYVDGYVGVWHLENSSDATGKGHELELPQRSVGPGYIGNGLSLGRGLEGIDAATGPALQALSTSDFTFSAMVNAGDVQGVGILFEVSAEELPLVRVGVTENFTVRLTRFELGEPTPVYLATSEDTLIPRIWHHVTVRHTVDGGTQIDIDGFESGIDTRPPPRLPVELGNRVTIGASANGTQPFTGMLDEVRVADVLRDDVWVLNESDAIASGLTILGELEMRP